MIRYIRLEEIGRGASGVVYKALDTKANDQVVAIKVFHKDAGVPKHEIIAGRQVTHRNVCRIFDYFEDEDGSDCLAMEYVDGGNLRKLIRESAPLPLDRVMSITAEVLDALEAFHAANSTHRDLKPENILLTSDGIVKVCDFGHARVIGTTPSFESRREPGTPAYMAPEQAMGKKCDARSDIYTLGLILGEVIPEGAPPHIDAAIERCTRKEPARRFASVPELREALSGAARMPSVSGLAGLLMVSAATLVLAVVPVWNHFWTNPPKALPPATASEEFSDGRYFLGNDLAADALNRFDRTLSIDSSYPGAQHYRGLALAKLNRMDEAIDAFKRALPRSEPERMVLWNWDAPSTAAEHGIIRGMDNIQVNLQRDFIENRKDVVLQKRVVYGERSGNGTVLYFLDLERRRARRLEIPNEKILLDTTGKANDSFTILRTEKNGVYAFSADGTLLWHKDLTEYGNDFPRSALIGDAFYIYSQQLQRFDLLDARTGNLLWRKDGLAMDGFEPPTVRRTKAYGDVLIVRSQDSYRALRKSNGTDAWTVSVQSLKASNLADDRFFIVFEPERRIFTVDLETGKTVSEVHLEQYADALPATFGHKWLVGAILDGNTLYLMSKDLELYAIGLTGTVFWHTPINKKMQSIRVHGNRLYLGTDNGELIVINAAGGAISNTTKVTDKPLLIDYAGDDAVLVASDNTLYGLTPLGMKNWEYPSVDPLAEATYFNGAIAVHTSKVQMSALDAGTGKVLWQYEGAGRPYIFLHSDRFFVVEAKGVKEYAVRNPSGTVAQKDTLTELARSYQAKGNLAEARIFLDKASEIDANYPPLVLVRSRLLKSQGHADEAGRELARYASLVGVDLKEGQQAISEVKRDYGLLWETAISPNVAGAPVIIENRLVSVGSRRAHELEIVALDAQTGAAVWRYKGERYVASVADGPFLWYVTGSQADETLVNLYRIDVRSGERKEMPSWHEATRVDQAWIVYEEGHIRFKTVSPASQETDAVPPRAALWPPSAFLVQGGRLYAYTAEGHAYAMTIK